MGWGEIFADPTLLKTAGSILFKDNASAQNVLSGVGSAYNIYSKTKEQQKAKDRYESALYNQSNVQKTVAQQALKRLQEDAILRQRLMQQTSILGQRLGGVYSSLGDIPAVDQATIAADYGALRSQSMDDFSNLVKLYGSTQTAQNLSNLGGARNPALESMQEQQFLRKYAPIQQQLDTAAYAEAINRSTQKQGLFATNRKNIYDAITGALGPQITAETNLLGQNMGGQLASTASSAAPTTLSALGTASEATTKEAQTSLDQFTSILNSVFNKDRAAIGQQSEFDALIKNLTGR